jgi:hypothetical protein
MDTDKNAEGRMKNAETGKLQTAPAKKILPAAFLILPSPEMIPPAV